MVKRGLEALGLGAALFTVALLAILVIPGVMPAEPDLRSDNQSRRFRAYFMVFNENLAKKRDQLYREAAEARAKAASH